MENNRPTALLAGEALVARERRIDELTAKQSEPNLRDDDEVSAVALVMESEADTGAPVAELPPEQGPNGQDDGGEGAEPTEPSPNGG